MHKKIARILIIFIGLFFISCGQSQLSQTAAVNKMNKLIKKISWTENYTKRKVQLSLDESTDINNTLPDITKFNMPVDPPVSYEDAAVEIFVSTEKSGKGTDGWIIDIANDFNQKNILIDGSKHALVKIRSIASGTGLQFITSGKYIPDAYSPSSDLWINMLKPYGIKTTLISSRLAGNVAGIVMKTKSYEALKFKYGKVDIKSIVNAVVQGDIAMGYTNPFASTTGINFLISVLYTFANSDESKMLSDDVVSAFSSFQQGVPFVAMTTMQMRDSVQKGGSLDAFVLEYQTFYNTKELKSGYEFIPFGIRHDNPLYAIGNLDPDKLIVLKKFAEFINKTEHQEKASQYGFNQLENYKSDFKPINGDTIIAAQKSWKEKKDSGREIIAVFLCDVSGSMMGEPISKLKNALIEGSKFINKDNSIGLVTFNHDVTKILPIKKFNLNQQSSFIASVQDMYADGHTAMYNGILVSLKMLWEEKQRIPNSKPILFVLTDGESNTGLGLSQIEPILLALKVPVFTIGYNANISVLEKISSINEAANINAATDDVVYKIGALLNAQM